MIVHGATGLFTSTLCTYQSKIIQWLKRLQNTERIKVTEIGRFNVEFFLTSKHIVKHSFIF